MCEDFRNKKIDFCLEKLWINIKLWLIAAPDSL